MSDKITQDVLATITQAIADDKNVILDAWYVKAEQLQVLFPETTITKVLLYCPLQVAYERLLKRNKEAYEHGNLEEKRTIGQLFGSFSTLYSLSTQQENSLEMIHVDEWNALFSQMAASLSEHEEPKPIFTSHEISLSQFRQLQAKFMPEASKGLLYLVCKEKYDRIIHSLESTSFTPHP